MLVCLRTYSSNSFHPVQSGADGRKVLQIFHISMSNVTFF